MLKYPAQGVYLFCLYCELGRTIKMQVERSAFYEPEDILRSD